MKNGFADFKVDLPVGLYEKLKNNATYFGDRNDPQVPGAPSIYKDVECQKLQIDLLPIVEQVSGYKLYPTYTYFRMYNNGSKLDKHVDRPACEVSVTLHIGGEGKWPIWVCGHDNKYFSFDQNPGEGVVYKGCEILHWREAPEVDVKDYINVFLHYVRADGPFANLIGDLPIRPGEIEYKKI